MRIMLIKCKCNNVFEIKTKNYGDRKLCDFCRKENKRKYNRNWRKNNPDYNRKYLRKWKKDCTELERQINEK